MIGIDLKGTLAEKKEFVSDKMITYLKDAVLITGQDIKDPQLENLLNRTRISAHTNNGAICWGVDFGEYYRFIMYPLYNKEKILYLVNSFIDKNKIPIHEPPKIWSDVQVGIWCEGLSLKTRHLIAKDLKEYLNDSSLNVCASGMNTIAV